MFKRSVTIKVLGLLVPLGVALLSSMPNEATAAQLRGFTIAPNWALGSPQTPRILAPSDVDPFRVFGHFGLGPLSDVLDFSLATRGTTEASLSENQRLFVRGLLEAGNEQLGDWWNLWIPNARWVGFGANGGVGFYGFDGDDPFPLVGDAIAYVNIGNAAHILWASNNSEDTSGLPADFVAELTTLGVTPTDVTAADGMFDSMTNIPTPNMLDCTSDPACTPTGDFAALPSIPEPATLTLIGTGLLGLAFGHRRRAIRNS